jgi:chromosomal replication initiator protein
MENNTLSDCTFSSFIVDKNNDFAYKAALDIANSAETFEENLVFYGETGVGKTHLLQAIFNHLKKANKRVLYVKANDFVDNFINSLQNKTQKKLRDIYINTDILLIDDIQFLQNKTGSQEELGYIFKNLEDSGKKIVCTSTKQISHFQSFSPELISFLENSIRIEITMPKFYTKRMFLQKKLAEKGIEIDHEIIDFIAKNKKSNLRNLENALTKITAYMDLVSSEITLDDVRKLLKE